MAQPRFCGGKLGSKPLVTPGVLGLLRENHPVGHLEGLSCCGHRVFRTGREQKELAWDIAEDRDTGESGGGVQCGEGT